VLNSTAAEQAFMSVFTPRESSIYNIESLQKLYNQDCQIVFWQEKTGIGVNLSGNKARILYTDSARMKQPPSPLYLFNKAGINYADVEIGRLLDKQNQIKSREYLNQTFRVMYYFLKPFIK
jgi:hypothetical protein